MRETEEERRLYWKNQMDAAYDFMRAIQAYPVTECGEGLRSIPEAVNDAGVRVIFSEIPHVRGLPRLFFLRDGLISDFLAAAREFNRRGWALRIEDAYRSSNMQKHQALVPEIFRTILAKVRWELGGATPSPGLLRRRLAALVAMSPQVGTHCCGSAIDVSVFDIEGMVEIDRGGRYIELSEKTPMDSPFISSEAADNRATITNIMARQGFTTYPFEFWHYNKGDAYAEYLNGHGKHARYGPVDFDPSTGAVSPTPHPENSLNSEEEIQALIEETG